MHNDLKDKVGKELRDFADRISEAPYHLTSGAAHMRAWLDKTLVTAQPLDVSYCFGPALNARSLRAAPIAPSEVMDLEPDVKRVVIANVARRRPKVDVQASDWAKSVYPMAVQLQATHGMTWEAALEVANTTWNDGLSDLPHIDAGDAEVLDAPSEDGISSNDADDHLAGGPLDYDLFA